MKPILAVGPRHAKLRNPALAHLPLPLLFRRYPARSVTKTQSNFQSTTKLLTPTIKWNQTPTVRRKPDCTI